MGVGGGKELPLLAIAVCTRHRATFDKICALGLATLQKPNNFRYEILLIENRDIDTAINSAEQINQIPVHHIVEKIKGLAWARNRALQEAEKMGARWVAFLDDDCQPFEDWLIAYQNVMSKNETTMFLHGQIWYRHPEGASFGFPNDPESVGMLKAKKTRFGGGNMLLHRSVFHSTEWGLRFDPLFDRSGGEDMDFRHQARNQRIKIQPVPGAIVSEVIKGDRRTLSAGIARHVNHGIAGILRLKKHGSRATVIIGLSLQLPRLGLDLIISVGLVFFYYLLRLPGCHSHMRTTLMKGARLAGIFMALFGAKGYYY